MNYTALLGSYGGGYEEYGLWVVMSCSLKLFGESSMFQRNMCLSSGLMSKSRKKLAEAAGKLRSLSTTGRYISTWVYSYG
jgi:hypothetical protein